jgi:hypothetical protein
VVRRGGAAAGDPLQVPGHSGSPSLGWGGGGGEDLPNFSTVFSYTESEYGKFVISFFFSFAAVCVYCSQKNP